MAQREGSTSPSKRLEKDCHYDTSFLKPTSRTNAILPPSFSNKKPLPSPTEKTKKKATPSEIAELAQSQPIKPLSSRLYSQPISVSPTILDSKDVLSRTDSPNISKTLPNYNSAPALRSLESPTYRPSTPYADPNATLLGRRSSTPTSYNTIQPSSNRKAWADSLHSLEKKSDSLKDSKVFMNSSFLERNKTLSPSPNSTLNQTLAPLLTTKSSSLENLRDEKLVTDGIPKKPKLAPVETEKKKTDKQKSSDTKGQRKSGKGGGVISVDLPEDPNSKDAIRKRHLLELLELDKKAEYELSILFERFRSHSASSEFFYLIPTRKRESDFLYNPYVLRLAKHDELDRSNYYTLSLSGITQFVNGLADFTSLDQFEREKKIYSKLMKIPLFRRYRLWKCYSVWKKSIRTKKTHNCRTNLDKNLFMLNENLRDALLQLQIQLEALQKVRLYRLRPRDVHTLVDFFKFQENQKKKISDHMVTFMRTVRGIIFSACDKALTRAGQMVEPTMQPDPSELLDMPTNSRTINASNPHDDHLRSLSAPKRVNSPCTLR